MPIISSLKTLLHSKIKELGYLSYGQVMQIAAEEGYKGETATRRLRELTDIEPVISKSKRGTNYISGYTYKNGIVPFSKNVMDSLVNSIVSGQKPEQYKKIEDGKLFTYKVYDPVTNFNPPL